MAGRAAVATGCCPPNPACILGTVSVSLAIANLWVLAVGLLFNAQPIIALPITALICIGMTWLLASFPFARVVASVPVPMVGLVLIVAARSGNLQTFINFTLFPDWLNFLLGGFGDEIENVLEDIFMAIPEGVAWYTLFGGGAIAIYNLLSYLESRKPGAGTTTTFRFRRAPINPYTEISENVPPEFGELPFITCK